jgi:hypothetical protein
VYPGRRTPNVEGVDLPKAVARREVEKPLVPLVDEEDESINDHGGRVEVVVVAAWGVDRSVGTRKWKFLCEVWRDNTSGGVEEEDGYAQFTESPDRPTLVVRCFPEHSTAVAGGWSTGTMAMAIMGRLGQASSSKGLSAFAQGIESTTLYGKAVRMPDSG